nr:GNAT family N-acetyltransferase [uncultured Agathobaculum sp.]
MDITDGKPYLTQIRRLIEEYAGSLGRDLSFQSLSAELADLSARYTERAGEIIAAVTEQGEAVGCVAYHRHSDTRCEMKRLYVKPAYRKLHLGDRLVCEIIRRAAQAGYREMVLDTIEPLQSAVRLYEKYGFRRIAPYYNNPMPDVIYMGLDLRAGRNKCEE